MNILNEDDDIFHPTHWSFSCLIEVEWNGRRTYVFDHLQRRFRRLAVRYGRIRAAFCHIQVYY
uniref:Uncharacterized protein n=1 Tax=Hyaloperonospora arabidopsidis (strain Emoy2) TaxID=559515 RepID=M4B2P9_HYAAE